MGSKVISFRLDDDKLALLNQHRVKGESESQAAMRLLLGALGAEKKKLSIQSVDSVDTNQIKELIETAVDDSLAEGKIGEAIANSYAGAMAQFNGLLEEFQLIKKQMEALQSIPPTIPGLPIEQLTTDNGQLTEDVDRSDSDFKSVSDLIRDPTRNEIENIRTTLKRRGIHSITNEKIRNAFKAAGWNGNNLKEIRSDILISLSAP